MEMTREISMKFAIGYQEPANGEPFSAIVGDYRESIAEVYFPWPGLASGRTALGRRRGAVDWSSQQILEEELLEIRRMGVGLDLLFNANCYGGNAISRRFEAEIASLLDYLEFIELLPEVVTTTSPFVAATVKKHFPGIEVRASVNMRIDSTLAMSYLADTFDSFHIRRDLQRDLAAVAEFHAWCAKNGKKLCMLANSGCLRNCPSQTFHDNLVAHDAEVGETIAAEDFPPHLCWKLYRDPANWVNYLRSSWIRPEDLRHYEPYFPVVKLATRLHSHPRVVIGAYTSGVFHGNLADLTEPSFSQLFAPKIIDNDRFPADWFEIAGSCAVNCAECGRCDEVWKQVLVEPRS